MREKSRNLLLFVSNIYNTLAESAKTIRYRRGMVLEKYANRILKGTITEYYFLKRMMNAVFARKK